MAALYPNIYQRGRKTTLLTQEEAAERLMKIIIYLDGGKYERGRNKVRPS